MRCGGEIVQYSGPRDAAGFRDALIVAHSDMVSHPLPHSLRDSKDPDSGHTVGLWSSGYSFNLTFDGITFVNYDEDDTQAWSNCAHCNFPNTKYMEGKTTYVKNIKCARPANSSLLHAVPSRHNSHSILVNAYSSRNIGAGTW